MQKLRPFQFQATSSLLTGVTGTAATDRLGKTAHGMNTGDPFIFTFGAGFTGLTSGNRYYAILVDADNIKVATTLANALAGTAVDITLDGTGGTIAKATRMKSETFNATSVLMTPAIEGLTYSAYVGFKNSNGNPDPRTPVALANPAVSQAAVYDLSELWVLTGPNEYIDVFGYLAAA